MRFKTLSGRTKPPELTTIPPKENIRITEEDWIALRKSLDSYLRKIAEELEYSKQQAMN